MAVAHDFVEEWKKLKPGGKIAVIGAFVAVAGYGLYQYEKNKGATAQSIVGTPASSGTNTDTSGVTGVGTPTSVGSPGGPLPPVPGPGQPTQGGGNPITNPIPQPTIGPIAGQPGIPLIPLGQYNGPSYSNLAPNTYFTYNYNGSPTRFLLSTGGGGRLYGQVNGQGNKILLYGAPSQYTPVQSPSVVK